MLTIKGEMDKLAYIKVKNFCLSRDTIKTVKRQPTKDIQIDPVKDLVSKVYDKLLQISK